MAGLVPAIQAVQLANGLLSLRGIDRWFFDFKAWHEALAQASKSC